LATTIITSSGKLNLFNLNWMVVNVHHNLNTF
jgi:hypothetical protein